MTGATPDDTPQFRQNEVLYVTQTLLDDLRLRGWESDSFDEYWELGAPLIIDIVYHPQQKLFVRARDGSVTWVDMEMAAGMRL